MTKFYRNRSEKNWKNDVFVGSLHANFDQNRLNVKKFPENRVLKETIQKHQYRCKMTSSTKWLSRNFKIKSFWQKKSKIDIFGQTLKKSEVFRNLKKTGIYVIEPHVYVLPSCQILRKSSIFGAPIVQKPWKTSHTNIFNCIFLKF